MRRFLWAPPLPAPDALERQYPISAVPHDTPKEPLGPAVLPGTYTLRLTVDGKMLTRPLTVKIDPRVKASAPALEKRFAVATRIADALHRDAEALKRVKTFRKDLAARRSQAQGGKLSEALEARDAEAAALGGGEGRRRRAARDGARDLATLNADLTTLYAIVEGADDAPTTQVEASAIATESALASTLARAERVGK